MRGYIISKANPCILKIRAFYPSAPIFVVYNGAYDSFSLFTS